MPSFQDIKYAFFSLMSTIQFKDVVDLLALAYIIYLLLKLVRETRAGQLIKGILVLVAAYLISNIFELTVMEYILGNALDVGLLAMLILFQPEIRRALEQFGQSKFGMNLIGIGMPSNDIKQRWNTAIEAICDSCVELSASCTGALIVIERKTRLGEQIETGTLMNAVPSKEVFGNIFYPKTPLHDGAVIMRDGLILAAACFLPRPKSDVAIDKSLGSRHRAAIGMSENSDAVVVVVSEETGQISVAINGVLTRDYTRMKLKYALEKEIFYEDPDEDKSNKKGISSIIGRRKKK
ncbi:MAG: diadenylate cyclase CdaA [Ruminococcus sp.]|jgi:diadenylate cyclase|nr:diadenylate cyclase CdaA [Ruminococcus sp.]